MKPCIYAIVSPSGKAYIGSTKNRAQRFREHKRKMSSDSHHCDGLKAACAKYGHDSFAFVVLEECELSVLIEREQWWIDSHSARFLGIYNASKIAGRPEHTPEVRAKIGDTSRGRVLSEAARKKISLALTGRKASDNAIAAMRLAQAGRKNTPEAKAKMSAAKKGKPRGPMSEATKEKIRQAKLGKKPSEEARANLSAAQLARYARDGGGTKSPETRARMSEAAYKREARKRVNP